MVNFWNVVNKVIAEADVLLEVLDGRMIDDTRNIELEKRVLNNNKKLIYVINKCDLVNIDSVKTAIRARKLKPSVFISAQKHLGSSYLRQVIMAQCKKAKIVVGVLGYPNTGKSTVINMLKGRGSAGTSSVSGFTKGKQLIKISSRLYMIDTPGVLPYKEKPGKKHVKTGTRSVHHIKEPDYAAMQLIEDTKGVIEKHYGVEKHKDTEETLEAIAIKLHRKKKGGEPDIMTAARKIIDDWQKGKIKDGMD